MYYTIRYMHTAARAAGTYIIRICVLDIGTFAVIDFPGKLIMREAEGPTRSTTPIMFLHFHKIKTRNRFQNISWFLGNLDTSNHMTWVMHSNGLVDSTKIICLVACLNQELADLKSGVDKYIFANRYILSEIRKERWIDPEAFSRLLSGNQGE